MPYQIGWLIENDVIYTRVWGAIDLDELRALLDEANTMLENSPSSWVHVINDSSDLKEVLPLHKQMLVYKDYQPNPRSGWTIMVGKNNTLKQFITSVATQLLGYKMGACETLPEAIDYLQNMVPHLEWHKAKIPAK